MLGVIISCLLVFTSDVILETQVLVSRLSFNVLVSVLVLGYKVLVLVSCWTLQAFVPVSLVSLELYSLCSNWHEHERYW